MPSRITEHIVDGLLQLGQDGIAEKLVQSEQQERAQHDGDQNLDGGVDVALAGVARQRAAGERTAAGDNGTHLVLHDDGGVGNGGLDGIDELFHRTKSS